jgi:hypothetical protein
LRIAIYKIAVIIITPPCKIYQIEGSSIIKDIKAREYSQNRKTVIKNIQKQLNYRYYAFLKSASSSSSFFLSNHFFTWKGIIKNNFPKKIEALCMNGCRNLSPSIFCSF